MANIIGRNITYLYTKGKSRFYKRNKNLWAFGEWFGTRCCDNSLYLANHIAQNHPEIEVVWVSKKNADTSLLLPSIRRVEMDTPQAQEVLCHAGVAIMNQGDVDFTDKGHFLYDGALTVNLWHGVPWKQIGTDMYLASGLLKKLYGHYSLFLRKTDLYLATSDDFSQILQEKYFAKKDGVILSGYPRNSIFYSPEMVAGCREKAMKQLQASNPSFDSSVKIITYMPTFRDNTQEVFSFNQLENDQRLRELLERHNAVVVQRAHFVTNQRGTAQGDGGYERITSLDGITSQELLAASDMLITDYSSCFFDFLMLDRPIIHHIYDYEYYANEDRGLYYKKEEVVCGDASQTVDELLAYMDSNLADPEKEAQLREHRRQKFMTYECADSCEKIYEAIQKRVK